MRTRAERRRNNYVKALRKKRIVEEVYDSANTVFGKDYKFALYDNLHQYSKNKVHCSCHLCSAKTRNKGKRRTLQGNYAPSYNPKISDIRKIERMDFDYMDYDL